MKASSGSILRLVLLLPGVLFVCGAAHADLNPEVIASTDPGKCTASKANIDLGTPKVSDNCGIKEVTNDAPAEFPVGDTIVTWTVVDYGDNTATKTQKVTVRDTEPPSIVCPSDVTVFGECDKNGIPSVTLGTPVPSDNCGVENISNDAPQSFPAGETVVSWTVVDIHGNSAVCAQKVTVLPTSDCKGQITEFTMQYNGTKTDALVQVYEGKSPTASKRLYQGAVQPGGQFTFKGIRPDQSMNGLVSLFVNGTLNVTIITNCNVAHPVGPGLVAGDFLVISGKSKLGGWLCPIK